MVQVKTVSGFFDDYALSFDAIYGTRNTLPNRLVNKYLRRSMRLRFEKTIASFDPIASGSVIDVGLFELPISAPQPRALVPPALAGARQAESSSQPVEPPPVGACKRSAS